LRGGDRERKRKGGREREREKKFILSWEGKERTTLEHITD
jgi:hypothetical protein